MRSWRSCSSWIEVTARTRVLTVPWTAQRAPLLPSTHRRWPFADRSALRPDQPSGHARPINAPSSKSRGRVPKTLPWSPPSGWCRTLRPSGCRCAAAGWPAVPGPALPPSGALRLRARRPVLPARGAVVELGVEVRVQVQRRFQFGQQRQAGLRLALQRAQHVQALDVAAAFPDRIERRLPVQARQHRLLDVAGAAQAFLRLVDEGRRALADPVLADGGGDARERGLARIVRRAVDRARDAHRQRDRRFGFDAPGRPARCASARARPGACRRCGDGARGASPAPAPCASPRPSRACSPAASASPSRGWWPRRGPSSPMRQRPGAGELDFATTRWTSRRACPSAA